MKTTTLSFLFLLLSLTSFPQDSIAVNPKSRLSRSIFSYGMGLEYGFIFAHSPLVENTKGSNPFGVEMNFSWQRNDKEIWDLCNCYPRKGLLLAYYNYDNEILGHGAVAGYFLEPVYRLNKSLFFSLKAVAGFAVLADPYHPVNNPNNRSYSTYLNVYLLVGVGLWVRISDKLWFNSSINYQHISNGGLREPNKGINWPTAGLGLSYTPHPMPFYMGRKGSSKNWKEDPVRWDAGLFGMTRRGQNENGGRVRVPLVGIQLQGSKQVSRINALTAGIEVSGDRALSLKLKNDSINASPIRAGFLAGHEFLLGKFIFSQRIGVYLFDQTPYFDLLYHCWGLHFRLNKHLGIGMNLKAHRHIAEYVDLRFVYSFSL